jgi:ubiquinone/menaquinone biosynthesis C-methylase UbiE
LDVGCGTGKLCFKLHQKKGCRIMGVDLSLRMLAFAKAHNHFTDVCFLHQDATKMVDIADNSYDLAIITSQDKYQARCNQIIVVTK